jgi:hypothetical protein
MPSCQAHDTACSVGPLLVQSQFCTKIKHSRQILVQSRSNGNSEPKFGSTPNHGAALWLISLAKDSDVPKSGMQVCSGKLAEEGESGD